MEDENYFIVRYFAQEGKAPQIRQKGLTRKQAEEHCQREDTHKAGVWFDGFTQHPPLHATKLKTL